MAEKQYADINNKLNGNYVDEFAKGNINLI